MSNWGNWKTSKNKWIVSVSYIFRKCDLLQRHCKLYKWYVVQIVDEIQSRRIDGYAVSDAVGRRKKRNAKLVCHGFEYNRIHSPLIEKNDG